MSWFAFALLALFCWSGSDLFSKIGCSDEKDKYSHLKMVVAVGAIMGLHAAYEIFIGGVEITWNVILTYLPVSLLYIFSMLLGYLGLRYIELSISSPICNTSGALVALLWFFLDGSALSTLQIIAIVLICAGVIGLGFVEAFENPEIRKARQEKANRKYAKSVLALLLPLLYCLLDALGTFADSLVLDGETYDGFLGAALEKIGATGLALPEDAANVAYELTFLAMGVVCLVILLFKKQKFTFKAEGPKYLGGLFETAGQFAYIMALGANPIAAAPMISAYCLLSMVWSRIFLKEKLSWKHYLMVGLAVAGIIILGVLDGLEA